MPARDVMPLVSRRLLAFCAAASTSLLFSANGTWNGGGADADWLNPNNWAGGAAPGATSGSTSTDIAIFNSGITNTWGASGTPILINSASLNIRGITFTGGSVGNFNIGTTNGNALYLTSGGSILIEDTATNNPTQTINAPLIIMGANGSYTFNNGRNNAASALILNGSISGGTVGNTVVNFSSLNTSAPNIASGVISDGVSTSLGLNHLSGTWTYAGNNTYSGPTYITTSVGGNAFFTGNNSGGGAITVIGGTGGDNANVNATFTGTNTYTGPVTIANAVRAADGKSTTGTITLGSATSAAGSMLGVTSYTIDGGRLSLVNTAGNADRINDGAVISLGGLNGTFEISGNSAANTTEKIGAFNILAGTSTIRPTAVGNRNTFLVADNLTRAQGFGTLTVNAAGLGPGTSANPRIYLNHLPTGANFVGSGGTTSGAAGVKNLAIIPWAVAVDGPTLRFLTYDTGVQGAGDNVIGLRGLNGSETQSTLAAASTPAADQTGDNVLLTGNDSTTVSKTINSLMLIPTANQSVTGIGGTTLTISSGALASGAAFNSTISGFDSVLFGNSEAVVTVYNAAGTITLDSSVIVGNGGGLTKTGAGKLVLNKTSTYSGQTTINAGTLQIGAAGSLGSTSSIFINTGATLSVNRADPVSLSRTTGGGTLELANTGSVVTVNQSGSGNAIQAITGVSGSRVIFAGDNTGVTKINQKLAVAGQTLEVSNGTVNLMNSRLTEANLEVSGGVLNATDGQFSMRRTMAGTQSLTISGGEFNVLGANGLKGLNNDNWNTTGAANTFTGLQTGGVFSVGGGNASGFHLGSLIDGSITTYALQGGRLSYTGATLNGFQIGAATNNTSTSTFSLSGGTLLSSQNIVGVNGVGAKQAFVWTGGVLATLGYNATNLTSSAGTAVSASTNTLTNAGGILAPGDIGTTGRTTITGNYAVTSADAALHIDIAGTTASNVFQDAPGAGRHDLLLADANNSTFALGGKLYVNLLDGFNGVGSFTIINNSRPGGTITGTFNNTVEDAYGEGQRIVLDNGLSSYLVTYNTQTVTLGSFAAENAWAGFDGSNWSVASMWSTFSPQAAGHLAVFNTLAAGGVVNLDSNHTIGGISFDNASESYTISSNNGSALTLDNTTVSGSSDAKITVDSGHHSIAVPLALKNNLAITTTGSTSALAISGAISGTGRSVTKSGTGSLTLSSASTYTGGTRVNAGSLFVNNLSGSGTGSGGVYIAAGATLGGSGLIDGPTVVAGHLASGASADSIAILTFNNAVTFKAGSSVGIDINGAGARGIAYDGLTFNSSLVIEGGSLTFNIASAIADGTVLSIFSGAPLTASFTSVSATGSGGYNGSFTLNLGQTAYTGIFGDQTLTLDLAGGTLSFAGGAIPEPSTYAILLGASSLVFAARRRRVRS